MSYMENTSEAMPGGGGLSFPGIIMHAAGGNFLIPHAFFLEIVLLS